MPTPPAVTQEQRRAGYEAALELRRLRRDLKRMLERDVLNVDEAIEWPEAQGMKVIDLLRALPGVGQKTAAALLAEAGIPQNNTVRQCGKNQLPRLIEVLKDRGRL